MEKRLFLSEHSQNCLTQGQLVLPTILVQREKSTHKNQEPTLELFPVFYKTSLGLQLRDSVLKSVHVNPNPSFISYY